MLIDTLLRWTGHNTIGYISNSDKWWDFIDYLLIAYAFPYLPYVLLLIAWIFFFFQRKQYKRDRKKFIKRFILFSVGAYLLGLFIPWLFVAILASLAAYSMYGGTI